MNIKENSQPETGATGPDYKGAEIKFGKMQHGCVKVKLFPRNETGQVAEINQKYADSHFNGENVRLSWGLYFMFEEIYFHVQKHTKQ